MWVMVMALGKALVMMGFLLAIIMDKHETNIEKMNKIRILDPELTPSDGDFVGKSEVGSDVIGTKMVGCNGRVEANV